jgi:predicted regulator of Ras-like GTPase activity (Roadblock/LC7/MglB family)
MEIPNFKLEVEEYEKILFILSSIHQKLAAESVYLINRNGQEIASQGGSNQMDIQAVCSLAASNLAATFGMASLIGEREFERIYHMGEKTSILMTPIGEHAFLLFLLDANKEADYDFRSLKQAGMILDDILAKCKRRTKAAGR